VSTSKKRRKKRVSKRRPAPAQPEPPAPTGARPLVTNAAIFAALGVLVGAGLGWYLRDARTEVVVAAADASAPTPVSSAGPCADWEKQICEGVGANAGDCMQAKAAVSMLPDKACVAALGEIAPTLEKLKQGRGVCTELAAKLCKDVGAESPKTCDMIKQRMAAMPTAACEERRQNYPLLLNQLKKLTNPGRRGPPGRPGGPPGGRPAGHEGHDHGPGHPPH
jgi:hypothetical protein